MILNSLFSPLLSVTTDKLTTSKLATQREQTTVAAYDQTARGTDVNQLRCGELRQLPVRHAALNTPVLTARLPIALVFPGCLVARANRNHLRECVLHQR